MLRNYFFKRLREENSKSGNRLVENRLKEKRMNWEIYGVQNFMSGLRRVVITGCTNNKEENSLTYI